MNKIKQFYPELSDSVKKELTIKVISLKSKKEIEIQLKDIGKELDNIVKKPLHESIIYMVFDYADKEGKWTWFTVRDWEKDIKCKQKIDKLYDEYHNKKTWKEILAERVPSKKGMTQKHKFYDINIICNEAKKRLKYLIENKNLAPQDEIFRFRLENKLRFYGFVYSHNFLALWHDPGHKIYPTKNE